MKRKQTWASSLMKTIEAASSRPFLWGEHDCVNFAANCVLAMTGDDPMADFRGAYDSPDTAIEALKFQGKGTLYHTMVSIFGQPASAGSAMRGDLIYQVFPNGPAIGVVVGTEAYFVGAYTTNEIETPGLQSIALSPKAKIFKV
jgi:hypothetical protein